MDSLIDPFVDRGRNAKFLPHFYDRAGKHFHLGGFFVYAVLRHGGDALRVQGGFDVQAGLHIPFVQADSFGLGDVHDLPHGAHQCVVGLAGADDARVRGAIDHAYLVDAHIQHIFEPHAPEDVLLQNIRHADLIKEGAHRVQILFCCGISNAHVQVPHLRKAEGRAKFHGVHPLGNGVDHMLPAEVFRDHILAGNAVQHGKDNGIRTDAGRHHRKGFLQAGIFDGHDHQVCRRCLRAGNPAQQDLPLIDGIHRVLIFFCSGRVHAIGDGFLPQRAGNVIAVQQAQGAHANDRYR